MIVRGCSEGMLSIIPFKKSKRKREFVMASFKQNTDAVSPVVGVMLMLTLVIILAAVISGFAGGIAGSSNSGSLIEITAETKIINSGSNTSKFEIDILSVSDPVSTKDLKLKTSWKSYDSDGNVILHDYSSVPGTENFNVNGYGGISPIGTGSGLPKWDGTYESIEGSMFFGNYTLMAGTRMVAYPAEEYGMSDSNIYDSFSGTNDCIQAVLGEDWNETRSGDVVNVMLIHVPSGRILYDEDVNVNLT